MAETVRNRIIEYLQSVGIGVPIKIQDVMNTLGLKERMFYYALKSLKADKIVELSRSKSNYKEKMVALLVSPAISTAISPAVEPSIAISTAMKPSIAISTAIAR